MSIVSPIEIFRSDEACYVVYEYMSFSLYYVTGSPRLDQIRLAAIIGQVIDGLIYLGSQRLEHEFLNCSNILIHPLGNMKIGASL